MSAADNRIHFPCPDCGRRLKIDARHSGQRVRCPRCQASLVVPEPAAPPEAEAPPAPSATVPSPPPIAEPPVAGAPVTAPSTANRPDPSIAPPRKRPKSVADLSDLYPAHQPQHTEEWIDMTAMVDIVFFLLIFFMVTSINSQQASIGLPVPETEESGAGGGRQATAMERFEADGDCIIVRIDDDNSVWLEDEEIPALVELPRKLREVADKRGPSSEPRYVLVLANGDSQHGTTVNVLDAAREAGLADLRLAVENVD